MRHGTTSRPLAHTALPALASLLLLATACAEPRKPPQTAASSTSNPNAISTPAGAFAPMCFDCHGDPGNGNPAPPRSVRGATATTDAAVGAHQAHLRPGAIRAGLSCAECHVVPSPSDPFSHIGNGGAALTWGSLAQARGAAATVANTTAVDGSPSLTCTNYCHAPSASAGGTNHAPAWTVVDGTQASCGTCHGVPPPSPHPAVAAATTGCAGCHPDTVRPDGTIDVAGGKHLNGVVDLSAQGCTACHGDATRVASPGADANLAAAPPTGTNGETAPTSRAVGAHQSHLQGGAIRGPLACTECHVVPTSGTHSDGAATVTFGSLARAGGAAPTWSGSSCGATYCHGGTLAAGGTNQTPTWTTVDGTQAACGTCHALPPPASTGHPAVAGGVTACATCHGATVRADGTIDVAGGKHIDGSVEVVGLGCTSCHGDATRPAVAGADANVTAAPPVGTKGETLPTTRAVGAHQAHVNKGSGALSKPIACTECHVVPANLNGHPSGRVDVAFGVLAATGGNVPVWSGTTCASTYCHGSFPGGAGATAAPDWTTPGALGCTSCHGAPPSAATGHPQSTACATCHPGYTATTVNAATHVNGKVDVLAMSCTTCHGTAGRAGTDPNVAAAPPLGTHGETATTARAVGAHLTHLQGGNIRGAIACTECHVVPTQPLHANGTVSVTFGALATRGGAAPAWNGATCASTYCHGATLSAGGTLVTPTWTTVDGTQAACGACHAIPPATSTGHPAVTGGLTACAGCHGATVKADGTIDVAGGKHVNGTVEVVGQGCTSCHGDATRVAVAGADLNFGAAPPVGTHGETATTTRAVGAHQAHVNKGAGALTKPIACSECHVVPTSMNGHPSGAVNVTFGILATTGGTVPAWTGTTCASTYCHGGFPGGAGSGAAPPWTTAGALGCTNCHGSPPAASTGHPQNTNCGLCHAGYTSLTVNLATHVNGVVDTVPMTCTTCHGTAGRTGADANIAAAPPAGTRGETATSTRAVGAHLAHLQAGNVRSAMACTECHVVPTQTLHANGAVAVAFGALAATGGAVPSWTGTTCASTYCHGATLGAGGTATQPVWTTVDGTQRQCTSCHGAPPATSTGHPAVAVSGTTTCAWCHPQTVKSDGTIDLAGGKHVNGALEVVAQTCTSCHGDATRTLVAGADLNGKSAPPVGTHGETLVTTRAVGAHQAHLNKGSGALAPPIACTECHAVPANTNGHPNGAVAVTFGTRAKTGGLTPTWNGTTCASTYCHGQFNGGAGSAGNPTWTVAGPLGCGSCHGNPPPASVGHPQNTSCGSCHPGYGPSSVNLATHVNGQVDVVTVACTTCHGTAGRTGTDPNVAAAPPVGTRGETATTARAVGAHLAHLQDGAIRAAVACTECHVLPAQQIHANGTATVTFGTLAKTGSTTPVWSGTTCASTYCHGATLNAGGSLVTPTWTTVNGTQAACGTCHAIPPPQSSGHPAVAGGVTACNGCHPGTVKPDGTIDVAGGKHVNGTLEVAGGSCTSCHGDANRTPAAIAPAPPVGTHGETLTSTRAVGAHQSHLVDGTIRTALGCTECHVVPASLSGHPTGTVNVTFGALATTGPTAPIWNGSSCAATYCHGATLGAGGGATTPLWTTVDGTQRQCTSCHGAPPPTTSGHPSVGTALTGCAACHPATVKADGTIDVAGGKHVNGTVEASGSCTSCHGDANRTPAAIAAAPPRDTQGSTSSNAVGAHLAHLTDGALRKAMACNDCHAVPSDTAHASQPLNLTWSALAQTGSVTPSWSGTSLTCTNYCHGITLFGGSNTSPAWNGGLAQAACGTCHGLPPTRAVGASQHPPVPGGITACSTCHPATVSNTGSILTANGTHVNGTVDLDYTNMTCTTCHGDGTRVLVAGADANARAAPPVGTHGESAPSTRAVGAHQAHLNKSGGMSSPIACAECHVVPTAMDHSNGTASVTFGALAKTGGVAPAWSGATCSSTYCHGNFTGGAGTAPAAATWTGAAMTCTSCHATWPATGRHATHQSAGRTCVDCHGTGYSPTTVRAASHVNGLKDVGGAGSQITSWTPPTPTTRGSCTPQCHGRQSW